jgi:uncharacterized membrane protein
MTWLQRYRLRHYVANSTWIIPVVSMIAAIVVAHLLHGLEVELGWESTLPPSTVQTLLATLAASMFTFIVFVCSALLIAVQLASSALTPRIIGIVFRDLRTKGSLVAFVFFFTFALAVLVRTGTTVRPLSAYLAAYGCLASLGVFVYLVDHVGKSLRPSGALWTVAAQGRDVIASVYPRRLTEGAGATAAPLGLGEEPLCTIPSRRDGVVLAFDIPGLVVLAQRADCVLELVPQVGDFVAIGDPLFRVRRGKTAPSADALCQSIAVGPERTLEQDPAFVFRIIVDIANKGLSPAINDPTTAVLALDQIHHLLRDLGQRRLDDERVRDRSGQLRLLYRTPDWEDFVQLAVTEIRHFGGGSIQVVRRMRALLENLIQTVPPERAALLERELERLHRGAERFFAEPEDRALAGISDSQGVGGRRSAEPDGKHAALPSHPTQPRM